MSRRDRQRRRRRANPGPKPSEPHRDNVPGSLDHASGDVDEFEAAIVAGAEGVPEGEAELNAAFEEEEAFEVQDAGTAAAESFGTSPERGSRRSRPTAAQPVAHAGGNRLIGFLRACVAELQRVQWPDRRQVGQATAVVIGFVVIAGAYLGLADVIAQRVIDFIL